MLNGPINIFEPKRVKPTVNKQTLTALTIKPRVIFYKFINVECLVFRSCDRIYFLQVLLLFLLKKNEARSAEGRFRLQLQC